MAAVTIEGRLVAEPASGGFQHAGVNALAELQVTGGVAPPPSGADTTIDFISAASGVIRAAPCTLLDFNGYNDSNNLIFIQFFNLVAVPADATVVGTVIIRALPNANYSIKFSKGKPFSVGCVWSTSSTPRVKTIAAADQLANAQFRV